VKRGKGGHFFFSHFYRLLLVEVLLCFLDDAYIKMLIKNRLKKGGFLKTITSLPYSV
jgi:hypothetical protein